MYRGYCGPARDPPDAARQTHEPAQPSSSASTRSAAGTAYDAAAPSHPDMHPASGSRVLYQAHASVPVGSHQSSDPSQVHSAAEVNGQQNGSAASAPHPHHPAEPHPDARQSHAAVLASRSSGSATDRATDAPPATAAPPQSAGASTRADAVHVSGAAALDPAAEAGSGQPKPTTAHGTPAAAQSTAAAAAAGLAEGEPLLADACSLISAAQWEAAAHACLREAGGDQRDKLVRTQSAQAASAR